MINPLSVLPRCHPANELEALGEKEDYVWCSLGDDPQFNLCNIVLLPGWHMLEVTLNHDQPCAVLKLYLDTGQGFDEADSIHLPLRNGRMTKRLFYVPFGVKSARLDPLETPGRFTLEHLRFAYLTPMFAHDRLAQRLVNMHFYWRGYTKQTVLPALKAMAAERGLAWRHLALQHYSATFDRLSAGDNYAEWIKHNPGTRQQEAESRLSGFDYQPLISVLLPVYNTQPGFLRACLDSVLAQYYPRWQLCVADDASTCSAVQTILADYAQRDQRICVLTRESNGNICAASNTALASATGEFVALLDHDDCLAPEALFEMVAALQANPDAGLLYSDEDKLDDFGERHDPHFKPQWNPDLLLAQNYISHLSVLRTEDVKALGGFREGYEGSQDHDLVLRITAQLTPQQIVHVPKVLYHWRAVEGSTALSHRHKSYSQDAGLQAVRDYLASNQPDAQAELGHIPNTYRVVWPLPASLQLVSLIVPTRDRVEVLQPCVDAILHATTYTHFELLIVDNGSRCPETLCYLREVQKRDNRVKIVNWNQPFNYSALNNYAVSQANGEVIGLINNDIEPITPEWLTEMVRQVCRPDIGCVGAKLYYPDDTVQHAGVILGIGGVAGHAHKHFTRHAYGYFSRLHLAHELSAVTGACLLVRKNVYEQVGGLNEAHLAIAFNDVDFCLKVREAGYRNIWTPYAELYHHESVSRGADDDEEKRARAAQEVHYMRATWAEHLDHDPAYNPNLTLVHEDFSLR
ncbi:glycosyltransferase family 2 protein [Halomonas sp. BLK-85]